MDVPTPEDVRRALAALDGKQQKIVGGMLTMMIKEPGRVREREWIAERLTEVTLLASELESEAPEAIVAAVEEYLGAHAGSLLNASYLLFQRVGLDLEPRAAAGFTFEEALQRGLEYLPSCEGGGDRLEGDAGSAGASPDVGPEGPHAAPSSASPAGHPAASPLARELGEQPLARLMAERGLKPADLVAASNEQLTHKMVSRAMKGRRLTANTMDKVFRAWGRATEGEHRLADLFDYEP